MASLLGQLITNLQPQHRGALEWFDQHSGQVVPWPKPLPDGTLLGTKAKGIYKPKWSQYALSVKQTLGGKYPDRDVESRPDGTWGFAYFQEDMDLTRGDDLFTNKGLFECLKDVVPVGVMIQVSPKPDSRYRIMGLALVAGYDEGYFYLEGMAHDLRDPQLTHLMPTPTGPIARADVIAGIFDPRRIDDERRRIAMTITRRQGQAGFRSTIMKAYEGRCAVTGYDAPEALEAAHIVPYRGLVTQHPSNGLLLRGDIHTLFDLGLIAVDADQGSVILGRELERTRYNKLNESKLELPKDTNLGPSRAALIQHREWAGL